MDFQRTLEETNAIHEFEPELQDMFVEGSSDKYFFDWYLKKSGMTRVSVSTIDLVDIPMHVLDSFALPRNCNRAKVIALSRTLASDSNSARRVMCIADRDSLSAIRPEDMNPYLFFTDGNALELYAANPSVLDKFLLLALGGFPLSVDSLMSQMMDVLEVAYAIRQANQQLAMNMSWVPFINYVSVAKKTVVFDRNGFIHAYLSKNRNLKSKKAFTDRVEKLLNNLQPEVFLRIRGHDFSELFELVIRKLRKERTFRNSETLEGCLMAALESSDLDSLPLFSAIRRTFG